MEASTLKTAILDAERFIKTAKGVLSKASDPDKEVIYDGKYCAAAKRASMDLTRSLANLRQGR